MRDKIVIKKMIKLLSVNFTHTALDSFYHFKNNGCYRNSTGNKISFIIYKKKKKKKQIKK